MQRRLFLLTGVLATTALLAAARPGPAEREAPARDVSEMLAKKCREYDVPGMVAIAITGEDVLSSGAAGVRARGSKDPVTLDDKFHIGSCTKAMTATLIATLVEDGTFSWSTSVAEVFGDVSGVNPAWRSVTLDQLLCMRGGAPTDLSAGGLWSRLRSHTGTPTEQRMMLVQALITRPPLSVPGSAFLYANSSFAIAGAMAEKKTGKSWEDLMRERLFVPLGMKSAGFGAPGDPSAKPESPIDQPRGHTADGKPVTPGPGADNPAAIGPAGTVHCSVVDWGRFVAAHLRAGAVPAAEPREGSVAGPALLSASTFKRLHSPYDEGSEDKYGYGWMHPERAWAGEGEQSKRVLTHAGSNTMWLCVVWAAPSRGFAVLVCCNQAGANAEKACDQAAWAMIEELLATRK